MWDVTIIIINVILRNKDEQSDTNLLAHHSLLSE